MKHYYVFLLLFSCLWACAPKAQFKKVQAAGPPATSQGTISKPATAKPVPTTFVTWDKKLIDLGSVKHGEKRTMFFEMTNTSGQPLKIDLVDACACTTTDYPRGIIGPGAKARIDATFDSTEKTAGETIDIRVIFAQNDEAGNPRVEVVKYKFDLVK